jgi:hypothetical protein
MTLTNLTYIIFELNAALDSGKYDHVPMSEASQHIESGDAISWLKREVPEIDLGLLSEESAKEYEAALRDIYGGWGGSERRKWGVERRALCLLIAWTNELIQQRRWKAD